MNQIDQHQLLLIIGGFTASGWYAPVNSSMTAAASKPIVSFKPSGISNFTNNMQDLESCYSLCPIHWRVENPKNGDRNALGQQYSWGTWWDDMN